MWGGAGSLCLYFFTFSSSPFIKNEFISEFIYGSGFKFNNAFSYKMFPSPLHSFGGAPRGTFSKRAPSYHYEIVHVVATADVEVAHAFNDEAHFKVEVDGFKVLAVYLQADGVFHV